MASFVTEFKHLEIQLEEIILATNNFDESKVIGGGGFGKVYAGELSHSQSGEKSLVAIKRLDRKHGQGDPEFFKEIRMLSCYRHENLISLLGFCSQGGEMILIYEYAFRGSLDRYLSSTELTWMQRLRICIDAAKGLSFLHDPNGTQQRVLHCDIKSANILLDKNMTAKVSDFGLSKMGPANQQYSLLITNAVGTPGYCDPLYMQTYSLTKESDVYSFGVVLFEVMCGRLCAENSNGRFNVYVPLWRKSYEENKLDDIILQNLRKQMDPSSLKTFSDIASQCLRYAREERPTMSRIVEELEIALESQKFPDLRLEVLTKYEDILMVADPLLIYKTGNQLKELLAKGLIIDESKKWFCINEKEQHIERIYIQACLDLAEIENDNLRLPSVHIVNSRFPGGLCYHYGRKFNARVRGQYLTPQISYTVNFVFRYDIEQNVKEFNPLRFRIDGEDEAKVFIIYPSTRMTEDGWFIAPLYQFTSQHKIADLQFEFEDRRLTYLLVAGIEFQPYEEKVQLQVFEEYQEIVKVASQSLFYTSLDKLKEILSKGIHMKDYKTWFSLNMKGEHCIMISIEDCLLPNEDYTARYEPYYLSRFQAGLYQTNNRGFKTHVKAQLLSPSITYTVNLVFFASSFGNQAYVDIKYRLTGEPTTYTVYLATHRREDGLYTAELFQFTSDGSIVDLEIIFENFVTNINGVEGILFQPLENLEDQVLVDDKVDDTQPISDSDPDTYWEQKLPNDLEEILKLSKHSVEGKTKKELYSILRKGFLIDNDQQWFTIDNNGKKCQMLSARATWVIDDNNSESLPKLWVIDDNNSDDNNSDDNNSDDNNSTWMFLPKLRFGEVIVLTACHKFEIKKQIKSELVSPETTYGVYLVYKLPQDQSTFEAPLFVWENVGLRSRSMYIYLVSPTDTPFIGPKLDENIHNPRNKYKWNAIPQQRTDDWMEVQVSEFQTGITTKIVPKHLYFKSPDEKNLKGLMVQGIELKPI